MTTLIYLAKTYLHDKKIRSIFENDNIFLFDKNIIYMTKIHNL